MNSSNIKQSALSPAYATRILVKSVFAKNSMLFTSIQDNTV